MYKCIYTYTYMYMYIYIYIYIYICVYIYIYTARHLRSPELFAKPWNIPEHNTGLHVSFCNTP